MRGIPVSEKYRGTKSDGIIYRGLAKNTAVYRPAVLISNKLSSSYNLFHFVHCVLRYVSFYDVRCPSHLADYRNGDCARFTAIIMKFTHNVINIYGIESVRARPMILTVGFLHKLSTIDDVTKYRGIPVSRYFLRRTVYIIVGHFLVPSIVTCRSCVELTGAYLSELERSHTQSCQNGHLLPCESARCGAGARNLDVIT